MKAGIVAAALVGSVAASQHNRHGGFHVRRGGYAPEEVCTVYTTVYVTGLPPMAANSTMAVPPTAPETSTTCTESSSVYIPGVPASSAGVPTPSTPAAVTSSAPVVPAVPASSGPAYPAVPASSKPVVPVIPASSTSCTEEEHKPSTSAPAYPAVPMSSGPAYPAVPASSKPVVPAVPASSKPVVPAVPASSKPVVPAVPASVQLPSFTPLVPTSSKPVAAKPTPSSSKPAPSSSKPAPSSSKPAPSSSKPAPSSSKPHGSKPTGGSYDNSGHIVTNGDKWSMTYTPYAENGDCKTADAVAADIKKIAELGFTTIRSYSTDCGVFEHVVPACQEHGLKVIYGIFLEAGGKGGKGPFSDYANEQLKAITDNAPKDSVAMVIVGNEFLFNNYGTPEELGSYIDYVRNQLNGAGFPSSIAVTTTEPVGTWEEKGAALCSHIDVFCAQIHPFFTPTVSASGAGDFAAQQLAQAAKVCPEAAAAGSYISEIGWPSNGLPNGDAVPGEEEQKIAIKSILEKVGSEACMFALVDDSWKAAGAFNVEQHWGCASALSSL
ncbi:beta-glucosidase 5 [Pyrenophora seminiperda CCB06]|uniref:Probable beta-glucosidase btgE n=1 Tax=Pyrenophora seminiperda CCB06 TaxID=1302712 RepID=A0A3M7LX88_9PLEO|nr:beta-glucosidase 5 [Pyrenophora seminiperda CCB06]